MKVRYAWALCLVAACGGSVILDPPQDPGMIPDASTDAPTDPDAGKQVIGTACKTSDDCGGDNVQCHLSTLGGYCTYMCGGSIECPSGSICAPAPLSRISGYCMQTCSTVKDCRAGFACDIVYLFPGQPNTPASASPVCWEPQNPGP